MDWTIWWTWLAAALVLAILEVFVPGFILLGFAIGAAVVGILMGIGITFGGSLPTALLVFAVASLIGWFVMRRTAGVRGNQVKVWDKDINDDVNG